MKESQKTRFAVCVKNKGYPASLEVRKIYETLPDPQGAEQGLVRVIDESGEDYLYPADYFEPIELSEAVEKALSVSY